MITWSRGKHRGGDSIDAFQKLKIHLFLENWKEISGCPRCYRSRTLEKLVPHIVETITPASHLLPYRADGRRDETARVRKSLPTV